ncbi:mitomycin resistance protein [Shewanella baltica]|uniref:helix-hairpin-helix domain-containing protein n=1 Tax=Shewanella baltica TaxID=62322 RepID=UPI0007B46499|nr:helix-hairpin-helix domain-containing protein [Shewanella baltica]KZK68567.1 mitomycin resistance protein [Shewanella baltica]MCS6122605.1 mitomycin resistance protein [Shewanella baltica]MCS6210966.1 mitomycin resistance protein [Shewanella baltica]MCS6236330.1 mitomycin resistance protein [Shewanella baltica]MCS6269508.1 mitomycin resistance protein [Shewanella baltica]
MNPAKVVRAEVKQLTDLPNIGKACAADLRLLGIDKPEQLLGQNPYDLYRTLCDKTGQRHDPCMIDVFISITRFMAGEDAKPWWFYTDERKNTLGQTKP